MSAAEPKSKFAFCEKVGATSRSPWCIRIVPDGAERMFDGGIQTGSLCGLVQPGKGWDLDLPVESWDHKPQICPECNKVFEAATHVAQVVVIQRSNDVHACILGEPGKWGCGRNADEAIGSLVRSWPDEFRVKVIDRRSPVESSSMLRAMVNKLSR